MDRGPDRRDEGWSMKSRQTGVVRCDGSGEAQTLTEREREGLQLPTVHSCMFSICASSMLPYDALLAVNQEELLCIFTGL